MYVDSVIRAFIETIQMLQLFICIAISLLIEFTAISLLIHIVIVFDIYICMWLLNGLTSLVVSTYSDCDILCVFIVTFVYINVTHWIYVIVML